MATERPRFYIPRAIVAILILMPLIQIFEIALFAFGLIVALLHRMQLDVILWAAWLMGLDLKPCGDCSGCRAAGVDRGRLSDGEDR